MSSRSRIHFRTCIGFVPLPTPKFFPFPFSCQCPSFGTKTRDVRTV